jgi:phosphoribosyl-ATP pyrophosphohydrolase/phosphoribosyl-AMP cyclohydrolase
VIIPSIALQAGRVLETGLADTTPRDASEPAAVARRLAVAGELAVTDVDAALGRGHNRTRIEELLTIAPCRVGGGIRDMGTAEYWLDKGATRIVVGTAATPELLRQLPRGRVLAALDVAPTGEVLVDGRRRGSGYSARAAVDRLRDGVAGFVLTLLDRPSGLAPDARDLIDLIGGLVRAAHPARVTLAIPALDASEVAALDALGVDVQVGQALHDGTLQLADAITASLRSPPPEGLWPTVVCDEHGVALGLCYSNAASVREALRVRRGIYASRHDGRLVTHGDGGANWQDLLRVEADAARETLRFTVRQHGGGFAEPDRWTSWGPGQGLPALARRLMDRVGFAPVGSYTRRLLDDPKLLRAKLLEEARELAQARGADEIVWEAADVFYFTMVSLARAGVPLADVGQELDRRARKLVRRKGETKPMPPPEFLEEDHRVEDEA